MTGASWPNDTPPSAPGWTAIRTTSTRWSAPSSRPPVGSGGHAWPPTPTGSVCWPATAVLLAGVGACSLVLPTAPFHPTIADVARDPVATNARLGRYTTFVNLLDLCAVSVPADPVDGLPFGVSFIGPAWSDVVQADLAARLSAPPDPGPRGSAPGRPAGPGGAPPWPWPGPT